MVCIACLLWGIVTILNSFANSFWELLILRIILGALMAFFGPAVYSLIADIFPLE
jgi:MFS family permease